MQRRVFLAMLIGLAVACGGKKDDAGGGGGGGGGDDVKWPAQPADGTPLAFETVEVTKDKSGKDLVAKIRIFNFTDKGVKSLNVRLHYLDASDKELKTFPWGASSGMKPVVAAKGTTVEEWGAFIPEGTKKVNVELKSVTYEDGSKWDGKK